MSFRSYISRFVRQSSTLALAILQFLDFLAFGNNVFNAACCAPAAIYDVDDPLETRKDECRLTLIDSGILLRIRVVDY